MVEEHDNNIRPVVGSVEPFERESLLKQSPVTIWFTGLSAAGKSTLAYALERELMNLGYLSYVLDGDNIRHGLSKDLDFTERGRAENIRRVSEVSSLMNDSGLIVIAAFISPNSKDRQIAKEIIGSSKFVEVFVCTPVEVCKMRDKKGFYSRAMAGDISNFTGVSSNYEVPECPDITINCSNQETSKSIKQILEFLLPRITEDKNAK